MVLPDVQLQHVSVTRLNSSVTQVTAHCGLASRACRFTSTHTRAKEVRKRSLWPLVLSPPKCKENSLYSAPDQGKNGDPLESSLIKRDSMQTLLSAELSVSVRGKCHLLEDSVSASRSSQPQSWWRCWSCNATWWDACAITASSISEAMPPGLHPRKWIIDNVHIFYYKYLPREINVLPTSKSNQ